MNEGRRSPAQGRDRQTPCRRRGHRQRRGFRARPPPSRRRTSRRTGSSSEPPGEDPAGQGTAGRTSSERGLRGSGSAPGRRGNHRPKRHRPRPFPAPRIRSTSPIPSQGRELYAQRKGMIEPIFGQLKQVLGFRQFSMRGLSSMRGEWRLLAKVHNLLKLWRNDQRVVMAG